MRSELGIGRNGDAKFGATGGGSSGSGAGTASTVVEGFTAGVGVGTGSCDRTIKPGAKLIVHSPVNKITRRIPTKDVLTVAAMKNWKSTCGFRLNSSFSALG